MFLVFFTCTCNRHIYKSASKFCVHNINIPSCLQTKTEHHRHRPSSFLHLRKRFVVFMLVQKQRFSNFRRTPTSGLFYLFYVSVSTGVVLIFISTILELNIKLHSPFHPLSPLPAWLWLFVFRQCWFWRLQWSPDWRRKHVHWPGAHVHCEAAAAAAALHLLGDADLGHLYFKSVPSTHDKSTRGIRAQHNSDSFRVISSDWNSVRLCLDLSPSLCAFVSSLTSFPRLARWRAFVVARSLSSHRLQWIKACLYFTLEECSSHSCLFAGLNGDSFQVATGN